jgi:hypothetical protein
MGAPAMVPPAMVPPAMAAPEPALDSAPGLGLEAGPTPGPESVAGGNPLSPLAMAATPQDAVAAIEALDPDATMAMISALTNIILPALAMKVREGGGEPEPDVPDFGAPSPESVPPDAPEMSMDEARDSVINRIMGSA